MVALDNVFGIWERVFAIGNREMTPEVANYFLRLGFDSDDHARMAYLNAGANEGTLTPAERAELEEYLSVADHLAILHSKARVALRATAGGNGHG